ncbi:MAG: hypothetical protein A2Y36_16070 [Treponema sp. GWA1_62_8]|nr:MAG: hypothetical protein A2Y36_16070 [Treponema sp. GWA1_62_8]
MAGQTRRKGCPPASATMARRRASVTRMKRHSWAFLAEGASLTALKMDSIFSRSTGLSRYERTLRRLAMASKMFMRQG